MMISSSAKQPARLCETQLIAPVSGSLLSRLLFSAACLHMGVLIYRKRRLARKNSEKSAD
jgi:hypothetical protein